MIRRQVVPVAILIGSTILGASWALAVRRASSPSAPVRQIVLEARETAFSGTNPTIEARAGERVRIVLRNSDPGVVHAIAVPELGADATDVRPGEEIVIEVEAREPGTFEYVCPHHLPLMKGKIVVAP